MATHQQTAMKRQKVRDGRTSDNVDYFQGIDKIEYNNMASPSESASYRYYNAGERVHSRPMEDWMRVSVSFTEFRRHGYDSQYRHHQNSPQNCAWDDGTSSLENHKRCLKALFDFCSKLGIKLWTAFDSDLVPVGESWEECRVHWDDIVEYIQELNQRYHMKLLWLAPDLHSHQRYNSGAMTSPDAVSFVHAAAQIKKCLEISQRLNAECFLLWPYKEGYDTIFQTDVAREIKLFAKLLKITAEYKDRLNYRCNLLLMPYYGGFKWQHCWRENDLVNMYMWDVTSCLYFLKINNLDRFYKVVSPPGHHMYMANVYNMLGGVMVTNETSHCDTRKMTLMMKCIIDQNAIPPAGINLKLFPRSNTDTRELVTVYVKYIDAIAKGLRFACGIVAEQMFSKYLQQRYVTYYSGFGARIGSSDVTLEECEEYCKKNQQHNETPSKAEHMDIVFQRYLDTCDHI